MAGRSPQLRALATLPLALTTCEWRMSAAVRCGRRMAGGRRSRLAAAACPTDERHQGGTRCGVALKRRSRETNYRFFAAFFVAFGAAFFAAAFLAAFFAILPPWLAVLAP